MFWNSDCQIRVGTTNDSIILSVWILMCLRRGITCTDKYWCSKRMALDMIPMKVPKMMYKQTVLENPSDIEIWVSMVYLHDISMF